LKTTAWGREITTKPKLVKLAIQEHQKIPITIIHVQKFFNARMSLKICK